MNSPEEVGAAASADYADILLLAWRGELDFTRVINYAEELQTQDRAALAAVLYQTWLQRNHTPYDGYAWFNLGVLLSNEGDAAAARDAYLHALEHSPHLFQASVNLGLIYERLGQLDEAVAQWQQVEEGAQPDSADERPTLIAALNNLGRLLEIRKQYSAALHALDKSLDLDPAQPDAIHHWVFLRARQCLWPVYQPFAQVTEDAMRAATSALAMIALSDDPEAQLAAARHYTARKLPTPLAPLAPPEGYRHPRLRIGYASSDLCQHPVAMLTAELFELHDREHFEIHTFDWSPEDGSELRQRIIAASDHFQRIDKLDDEAAAQLIRAHEIDILIDLQGQTSGARAAILTRRPAPIQITWLGLPATCGLPNVDYVLADRFLIPEASAQYFSEQPLYLPNVYQPSDRRRPVGPPLTRADCGLPETGFIFCCFNNNYKYTADLFAVWMKILTRTPDSILWLLADNPWAHANLIHQLDLHHIARERVIFAERATPDIFRARLAVADLFLDTFPFNAGTTANDALWMSLPVLTCAGRSFASRMAGALLTAAGLDELITTNLADYEEKAVALAHTPADCQRLRARLAEVKAHGALFDTPRLVRDLEATLTALVAPATHARPAKTEPATPDRPFISFVIPFFNRYDLLERAVNNILASPFKDLEIIVVDDASTAEGIEATRARLRQHPNIVWHAQPENRGPRAARLAGAGVARGEWVFFLDSDDLVFREILPDLAAFLARHADADVDMAFLSQTAKTHNGNLEIQDRIPAEANLEGEVFTPDTLADAMARQMVMGMSGYIYHRRFLLEHPIPVCQLYGWEDSLIAIEFCIAAKKIALWRQPFYIYNLAEENRLSANMHIMWGDLLRPEFNDEIDALYALKTRLKSARAKLIDEILLNIAAYALHNVQYAAWRSIHHLAEYMPEAVRLTEESVHRTLPEQAGDAYHNGDYRKALSFFSLLRATQPENAAHAAFLALTCAELEMNPEAEHHIADALRLAPARQDYRAALGGVFLRRGHPELAEPHLIAALFPPPEQFVSYLLLAEALRQNGKSEQAIRLLASVADLPSPVQGEIRNSVLHGG